MRGVRDVPNGGARAAGPIRGHLSGTAASGPSGDQLLPAARREVGLMGARDGPEDAARNRHRTVHSAALHEGLVHFVDRRGALEGGFRAHNDHRGPNLWISDGCRAQALKLIPPSEKLSTRCTSKDQELYKV